MMTRIRTIKPEYYCHEGLYDAEQATGLPLRVAFAGLFCCVDREGRFRWRARQLKLHVLPYDEIDFESVLNALAQAGLIVKYTDGHEIFGCIPSWHKHQRINLRESASELPAPPQLKGASAPVTTSWLLPEGELAQRVSSKMFSGQAQPSAASPTENVQHATESKSKALPEAAIATAPVVADNSEASNNMSEVTTEIHQAKEEVSGAPSVLQENTPVKPQLAAPIGSQPQSSPERKEPLPSIIPADLSSVLSNPALSTDASEKTSCDQSVPQENIPVKPELATPIGSQPQSSPEQKEPLSATTSSDFTSAMTNPANPIDTSDKSSQLAGDPKRTVNEIFQYWVKTMQCPEAKFDQCRQQAIEGALRLGFSPQAICQAIKGCSLTPYNMGENPHRQKFNGLQVILRDAEQIERFIRHYRQPPSASTLFSERNTKDQRALAQIKCFVDEMQTYGGRDAA